MIDSNQFRSVVVRPTLKAMGRWSPSAEALLMGTAAVESNMGQYLVQVGGGPARGVMQMEPATHDDIVANYLAARPELGAAVLRAAGVPRFDAGFLVLNLAYSIAMARVHFLRRKEPLPDHDDVEAVGWYWKKFYNTPKGAGTVVKFIEAYERFVDDEGVV